jgi:hypothetical protein
VEEKKQLLKGKYTKMIQIQPDHQDSTGVEQTVGVVCKLNKEKMFILHWKETLPPNVSKCGFLLCSKLNNGGQTLLFGFLMLLYGYL